MPKLIQFKEIKTKDENYKQVNTNKMFIKFNHTNNLHGKNKLNEIKQTNKGNTKQI